MRQPEVEELWRPGRPTSPTGHRHAEEEAAAEANVLDPEVAAHEREMGEIGAKVKGEGQID